MATVTLTITGEPNEIQQTLALLSPQGASPALIHLIQTTQEQIMSAVQTINDKLTETATVLAAEATQVNGKLAELAQLAASERITPEQLSSIVTRFDGVISGIKGLIPDDPTTQAAG